jgi:HPt (histidine-containing phosphotransfer) domain-containing protein
MRYGIEAGGAGALGRADEGRSQAMTDFDDRMAELRSRFIEQAGKDRERLAEALRNDDHATLSRIAHGLSGRAGMFGFPDVSEKAAALESALDDEPAQLRPAYEALLESLELAIR